MYIWREVRIIKRMDGESVFLVVQNVFEIQGRGTVVAVHVKAGAVSAGDELQVVHNEQVVETIRVKAVEKIPGAIGLLLDGSHKKMIRPGMTLVSPTLR
jgi:translation elongation factor EF-Tu-like GTPase